MKLFQRDGETNSILQYLYLYIGANVPKLVEVTHKLFPKPPKTGHKSVQSTFCKKAAREPTSSIMVLQLRYKVNICRPPSLNGCGLLKRPFFPLPKRRLKDTSEKI